MRVRSTVELNKTQPKPNEGDLTSRKNQGGDTAPKGFIQPWKIKAGIKKRQKDMAMIYSSTCVAAGTFTTNQST